ncbi:MAG: regulatory protein RecX [Dehalococcoidia bacterium]|nr:regulatory protein RecX [Dehalococcoidia bacterium]
MAGEPAVTGERTRIITGIEAQRGHRKRLNIFLDNKYAFSIDPLVAEKYSLHVGIELDPARLKILRDKDQEVRAYAAALLLLKFRKRGKRELEKRLGDRGFEEVVVSNVIHRLEVENLVDDVEFVKFWQENRQAFNPKGKRFLDMELKRAGIDSEIIEAGIKDVNEEDGAYRSGRKKLRIWSGLEYLDFKRKMGAYLARRGYPWDIIGETIKKLWEESSEFKAK